MNGHRYTPEQDAWLREHAQLSRAELTARFNEAHGTELTEIAIRRHCTQLRAFTGRTGRFEAGHRSWQTGVTGEAYWAHFTPETRAEVTERITPKAKYAEGETVCFPSQNGRQRVVVTGADGRPQYRCRTQEEAHETCAERWNRRAIGGKPE